MLIIISNLCSTNTDTDTDHGHEDTYNIQNVGHEDGSIYYIIMNYIN